ncbi:MAG TPA: hypothetical protein VNQ73_21510 [Ilumatobacter sp.]|nr:hypothetical protein [Ilumatobacter sp.]
MAAVFHFSEDPTIRRFSPHVPRSNPSHPPSVWAIDAAHAPLYWFPRECPRASVWSRTADEQERLREYFGTEAERICATESGWFERVRAAVLYRYTFDAADFVPWPEADGQYIAHRVVEPVHIEPLADLLALHVEAGVELRLTPRLGALTDQILASGLPFSLVRLRNALV